VRLLLEEGASSATVYLGVDDVRARIERIRGMAEIVSEPHLIFHHADDSLGPAGMDEWQAFFRDSEGNVVGIVSWAHPDPGT
jgi:methylmalonyl-CoA/ethylmalonyl-CoA epimerase